MFKLSHRLACSYTLHPLIYLENNEFTSRYWKMLIYLRDELLACFLEQNTCIFICRQSHACFSHNHMHIQIFKSKEVIICIYTAESKIKWMSQ